MQGLRHSLAKTVNPLSFNELEMLDRIADMRRGTAMVQYMT
ncbi:hypothetical protein Q427_01460 [Halomonas sp. BC04]|nr:hypothetical protein Q427_01460 [Halomonas sp. BC04]